MITRRKYTDRIPDEVLSKMGKHLFENSNFPRKWAAANTKERRAYKMRAASTLAASWDELREFFRSEDV